MALCFSNRNAASLINPQVLPLITVAVDVDCFLHSVTSIGKGAFAGCGSLESIKMPSEVRSDFVLM